MIYIFVRFCVSLALCCLPLVLRLQTTIQADHIQADQDFYIHIYTHTSSVLLFSGPAQEPLGLPGPRGCRRVEARDPEQVPRSIVMPVSGLKGNAIEADLRDGRPLRNPHHRHIAERVPVRKLALRHRFERALRRLKLCRSLSAHGMSRYRSVLELG